MDLQTHINETRHRIDRQKRLAWNENQMKTAARTIASSLKDIHDNKLWEGDYATFEKYCEEKWGMTRQRAYQLIGAEDARLMLQGAAPELADTAAKMNDLQASEFANLGPEKAAAVFRDAVEKNTKGKMTAAKIKQAKARIIDGNPAITTAAQLPHKTNVAAEVTESEAIEQAQDRKLDLFREIYLRAFNNSGEGYNGEYPFDGKPENDADWCRHREEVIAEVVGPHCGGAI